MAQYRPAGLSDEDTDSDDYGFFEKPVPTYEPMQQHNERKRIEMELQEAILNGNVLDVEQIVTCELKNNVNVQLDSGWTILMHACFHAQEKIVLFLLDRGADPNLNADSVTPLMAACSNSSANNDTLYSIVCSLIAKDCVLNIGDKYGQTPLMRAISSGRVAVVQKLVDSGVNIEMRDQQGWTAVFWAAHHNQPEILEILIANGARLAEVDKSGRSPLNIAESHDYQMIMELLNKQLNPNEDDEIIARTDYTDQFVSWYDYYPGVEKREKPTYKSEIENILYGMKCERLRHVIIDQNDMDLRTFLLLEETDMIKLGIDMPFERQRLKLGLRNFHIHGWKLNAVSGLYARKVENYCVLDCLTTLGTHLQQVYILEATLQYCLREYNKLQNQMKFEPPDSPLIARLKTGTKKMLTNINSIRREARNMKQILTKISKNNPEPADLIKEKSVHEIAVSYLSDVVVACSIGFLVYYTKTFVSSLLNK